MQGWLEAKARDVQFLSSGCPRGPRPYRWVTACYVKGTLYEGSVAMHLWSGEIFNNLLNVNLQPVKAFWKLVEIW